MSIYVTRFYTNKSNPNRQSKNKRQHSLQYKIDRKTKLGTELKDQKKINKINERPNPMAKSKSKSKNILIAKSAQLLTFFDSFDKENQKKSSNKKKQFQNSLLKNQKSVGQSLKPVQHLNFHYYRQLEDEYPLSKIGKQRKIIKNNSSMKSLSLKNDSYKFNQTDIDLRISSRYDDYKNSNNNEILEKYDSKKYDWRLSKSKSKQKSNSHQKNSNFLFNFNINSQKKLKLDTKEMTFKPAIDKLKLQVNQQRKMSIKQKSTKHQNSQRKDKKVVVIKKINDTQHNVKRKTSLATHKQQQKVVSIENQHKNKDNDKEVPPLLYTFGGLKQN